MTPEQALQNLYNASRLAKLTAEEHELLRLSAQDIKEVLEPKKDAHEPRRE